MVIAVDFDNTLYLGGNQYPSVDVEPNLELINLLLEKQREGAKLILWTCRCGKPLDDAVQWCKEYGLEFDAINDDIQETKDEWGPKGPKIFADIYIDDSALQPLDFIVKNYTNDFLDWLKKKDS